MTLPEPDAASAAHSACCAEYIHDRIRDAGGSISFAEYMHHALYAPGVGYYTAGATKFGVDGDFVTAPEISPIFGRVLARQCAAVLDEVEHGSILEFGAGSGKLAADLLRTLDALDALPDSYLIIEVSADLRERQERYLRSEIGDLVHRVRWLNRLPEEHAGVVVANEVLDALPVERFVRRSGGIGQIRVAAAGDGFKLVEEPAPELLATAVQGIEDDLGKKLPPGFASEVSLAASGWVTDISGALKHGVVFLFDYGLSRREYYAADRAGGWLR
ncbi:MAG: SAM-dependent methyltransferase, partial [Proteobacteria bacterium]|nr:SAM-dependent methyltransferase [Pseudomonadota bacterium]